MANLLCGTGGGQLRCPGAADAADRAARAARRKRGGPSDSDGEPTPQPLTIRQALTSRPFLLLVGIYSVCGFQDFFVATHIVAFAQDQGVGDVLAGNLLAWMGVMGLLGVFVAGIMADASARRVPPCCAS